MTKQSSPETHPFGEFVPKSAQYLIIGSFPSKDPGDWFYGSTRNQFWKIIQLIYKVRLENKQQKLKLFRKLKISMADIILSCSRRKGNNSDSNLTKIIYNKKGITRIIREQKITRILFTSAFVERTYKKIFKNLIKRHTTIQLIQLPSPSPRSAKLSLYQKARIYKKFLPQLDF